MLVGLGKPNINWNNNNGCVLEYFLFSTWFRIIQIIHDLSHYVSHIKKHDRSQLITFLKDHFCTNSFTCRILQPYWMCLGILFIFYNSFHICWSVSCVELCETTMSRLSSKKTLWTLHKKSSGSWSTPQNLVL